MEGSITLRNPLTESGGDKWSLSQTISTLRRGGRAFRAITTA